MPPPQKRARRSPSPLEDAELDLIKLQADLDASLDNVRALVNSWVPQNLDSAWETSADSGNFSSINVLEDKARPPRLGLGASVSKYHKQQAEDRKLRNQLLSHVRKHKGPLEPEEYPTTSAKRKESNAAASGEDDDEGESRASSIKRANGVKPTRGALLPVSTSSTEQISIATRSSLMQSVAPAGFFGGPTPGGALHQKDGPLTKNQRKKERERQKKLALQHAKLEEIRKEEEAGSGTASGHLAMGRTGVDSTSSAQQSNSSTKAIQHAGALAVGGYLSDGVDASEGGHSSHSALSSPTRSHVAVSDADSEKKKKKKRRRKSKGAEGDTVAPLLNL